MKTTTLFSAITLTLGLVASSASFAQVKIGTNPATIGANSNLEVEATNNKKVIVNKADGTVVIENTPVGTSADKLLAVDASGNVRTTSLFVPSLELLAQNSTGTANFPAGNNVQRIDLNPASEFSPDYNTSLKEFTVTETGVYMFTMDGLLKTSIASSGNMQIQLRAAISPEVIICSEVTVINNSFFTKTTSSGSMSLTAGDKVFVVVNMIGAQTLSYEKLNIIGLKVHD